MALTGDFRKSGVDVRDKIIIRKRPTRQSEHLKELQAPPGWDNVDLTTDIIRIQVCCIFVLAVFVLSICWLFCCLMGYVFAGIQQRELAMRVVVLGPVTDSPGRRGQGIRWIRSIRGRGRKKLAERTSDRNRGRVAGTQAQRQPEGALSCSPPAKLLAYRLRARPRQISATSRV